MSENMVPVLMLLSGAFVGFVEIAIAVRFMSWCEEWQRVGMLVCGVACIVFVAWGCLNVFAPKLAHLSIHCKATPHSHAVR